MRGSRRQRQQSGYEMAGQAGGAQAREVGAEGLTFRHSAAWAMGSGAGCCTARTAGVRRRVSRLTST
jgi:hypothetical protein